VRTFGRTSELGAASSVQRHPVLVRLGRASMDVVSHEGGCEVVTNLSFPFPDSEFPAELGAIVQRTLADGEEPARVVIHDADNEWLVGDGVNDPNEPDACVLVHMAHVVERNSSIAALASLPLGYQALRDGPGKPWEISPHVYDDDEE
jgi:hypothetical protein